MYTEIQSATAESYESCSYGLSRMRYRGPRSATDGRYIAVIGGSDTIARQIETPFPALLAEELGTACVNLGVQKAGTDVFLQDSAVTALIHDARSVVIQVVGATNLSNRYYRVHPRRNDRFIAPTDALRALFPHVDLTDVAFTGHLLERLYSDNPEHFSEVVRVLQGTWVRRMRALIAAANGPVFLLWFGDRPPDAPAPLCSEPALVTQEMLDAVTPLVENTIKLVRPHATDAFGSAGAKEEDHREIADALADQLAMSLI